jgi:outer membrane protein TolC
MRLEKDRVAKLAALAVAAATLGCTPAATQASIRSAESAAETRAFAGRKPLGAPPVAGSVAPVLDEASPERSLEVSSLEAAAIARQPSLVAAAHRVRALVERARAEGKLPPPELMADVWQVPFAKPYALDKAGMIMFTIRQQFPAAGALDKMAEATALEAEAEVARASAEARALVREVDRTFVDYAEASARHDAHDAHRAVVAQMVGAARARYETGGPLGDFTRAELERARTDAELEREHGMIDAARVKLNGLMARPPEARLGAPAWAEPRTVALTLEQAAEIAAAASPEVLMAERMERSARAAAEAANREAGVPMFSAGLSTFLPVNDMPVGYGVSLSMSLPWAWGAASARARSAEQRALAGRAAASGARLRTRTDAATALTAVRSAERRYLLLRDGAAPAARRAVEATRAGYAAGGADILMWLDAARTALEIDLDLAGARGDLDRALADLDGAAGARVPRVPLPAPKEAGHVR